MNLSPFVFIAAVFVSGCSPNLHAPHTGEAFIEPTQIIPTSAGSSNNQIRAKPQPNSGQKSNSNTYKLISTAAAQVPTNYAGSQIATSQGFKLQGGIAHAQ